MDWYDWSFVLQTLSQLFQRTYGHTWAMFCFLDRMAKPTSWTSIKISPQENTNLVRPQVVYADDLDNHQTLHFRECVLSIKRQLLREVGPFITPFTSSILTKINNSNCSLAIITNDYPSFDQNILHGDSNAKLSFVSSHGQKYEVYETTYKWKYQEQIKCWMSIGKWKKMIIDFLANSFTHSVPTFEKAVDSTPNFISFRAPDNNQYHIQFTKQPSGYESIVGKKHEVHWN